MSDEWISIEKNMPPINKKVEVLTYGDYKHEACLIYISDGFCLSKFEFKVGSASRATNITHWRHIQEKRPNFSKLREGDLIEILIKDKYISAREPEVFLYHFSEINIDNIILFPVSYSHYKEYFNFPVCRIKKITRISIEKQTFEEI